MRAARHRPRRPGRRAHVGAHVPRRVPADAARERRAARLRARLHGLRRHRHASTSIELLMQSKRASTCGGSRRARSRASISAAKSQLARRRGVRARTASATRDPYRRRIAMLYERYDQRLHAANAMDFDDLLANTVRLFRTCPDVLDHYRKRFRHVLVDEYQDTNLAQDEIVRLLAAEHRNICVVGDADQCIYRFRAADVRNILEFETHFPDATVVLLGAELPQHPDDPRRGQRDHREQPGDAPQAPVHRGGPGRAGSRGTAPPTSTTRPRGSPRRSAPAPRAHGISWGDVAIFYRTNAQSRVLEDELVRAEIPYKVVGGHALLRPARGEGRPRVPPAVREPVRRGRRAPHRERPEARGSARRR